jgi:hypothetical protein
MGHGSPCILATGIVRGLSIINLKPRFFFFEIGRYTSSINTVCTSSDLSGATERTNLHLTFGRWTGTCRFPICICEKTESKVRDDQSEKRRKHKGSRGLWSWEDNWGRPVDAVGHTSAIKIWIAYSHRSLSFQFLCHPQ